MDSTRGNGRYPADIDHLDDILSIGEGHELPEGAEVISVKPSTTSQHGIPADGGTSSPSPPPIPPSETTSQPTSASAAKM